jgi:nicotinamide riboside kinase
MPITAVRIALVGPESSGKSTLAEELMMHGHAGLISDGTREYLDELERPYEEHDLLEMARSHAQWFEDVPGFAEDHWVMVNEELLGPPIGQVATTVFDTDILNFKIWSQEKFGRVHPEIERLVSELHYDLRLLCRPDIPWEPDPLRENPSDRDRLFTLWERELQAINAPYVIIEGDRDRRLRKAVDVLEMLVEAKRTR